MNFDDLEIPVEDGNAPIKLIFIPDYLKSKDLSHRGLRITPWHSYSFDVIQRSLKDSNGQCGINFIRRRMIKYGLGLLEKDCKHQIDILTLKYDSFLLEYDRKIYCAARQNNLNLGDSNLFERIEIYIEEDDLGRIGDLSKILHIHQSSIMRISIAYSIKNLDCFGDNVMFETTDDIEQFKNHLTKTSK